MITSVKTLSVSLAVIWLIHSATNVWIGQLAIRATAATMQLTSRAYHVNLKTHCALTATVLAAVSVSKAFSSLMASAQAAK